MQVILSHEYHSLAEKNTIESSLQV